MILIFKVLVIVGLIKLLFETDSPLLCAGIYAGAMFIFAAVGGAGFGKLILLTAITMALSYGYFWLLNRFQGQGILYWFIMVIGFLIVLF